MAKKTYKPINFRVCLTDIDKKNIYTDKDGKAHADFTMMLDEEGTEFTSKEGKKYKTHGFVKQQLNSDNYKKESEAVKAGTITDAQRTQMPILGNCRIWAPAVANESGIPGEGKPVTDAEAAAVLEKLPF